MSWIVLDRQHAGKPHRPKDLGAHHDLDGDGLAQLDETEVYWTALYGLAAEMRLRWHGYKVIVLSHGTYPERHAWVNEHLPQASVYIAMHLNGGAPKSKKAYASTFYDYRSRPGRGDVLAAKLSERLGYLPEIGANRRIWKTAPTSWKRNAHSTIRGVDRAIGICYEPAFIDAPEMASLFTMSGMQAIGHALADGIHDYLSEVTT